MQTQTRFMVGVLCALSLATSHVQATPLELGLNSESNEPTDKPTVIGSGDKTFADVEKVKAAAQLLTLYQNELDCENVGYIQTGEADEHFAPIFLASDADRSRSLSREEFLNNPYAPSQSLLDVSFVEMDKNSDEVVSPDELRLYLSGAVKKVDGDNNGDIYPDELAHALKTGRVLTGEASALAKVRSAKQDSSAPWLRFQKATDLNQSDSKVQSSAASVGDPSQVPSHDHNHDHKHNNKGL